MRIIAGEYKGIRLAALKDVELRPTLDRVRESLFNQLAPEIEGARFLDLFSGTGAVGLEALSRGAEQIIFMEQDVPTKIPVNNLVNIIYRFELFHQTQKEVFH